MSGGRRATPPAKRKRRRWPPVTNGLLGVISGKVSHTRSKRYTRAMAQSDSSDLLERALQLQPDKRVSLAAKLLDSVEEPDDAAWAAEWAKELDTRLKAVESGDDPGETWETVKARALAGLRND